MLNARLHLKAGRFFTDRKGRNMKIYTVKKMRSTIPTMFHYIQSYSTRTHLHAWENTDVDECG